jgi:tRNA threonylcarbamoyladenosine biosynthesis protein TsaE
MKYVLQSSSAEETQQAGFDFAKKLKPMDVVFLKGELGAGKTTFVQGLAKGLGITNRIISPTFIVVREYVVEGKDIQTLYHLDLYRLKNDKEVESVDIKDCLDDKNGLVVIEWPEIGQDVIKKDVWEVRLVTTEDNGRSIEFNYGND